MLLLRFVKIGSAQLKLRLYRKDRLLKKRQKESVADVPLSLQVNHADHDICTFPAGECRTHFLSRPTLTPSSGPHFTVDLTLGDAMTVREPVISVWKRCLFFLLLLVPQAADVAERHFKAAKNALDAQASTMDRIDSVTTRLKLVMKIGTSVAQVRCFPCSIPALRTQPSGR